MNKIGYSFIGTPKGFQHKSFGLHAFPPLEKVVDRLFDLENRYLILKQPYPEQEAFYCFKSVRNGFVYTHYVTYRYAQSSLSNRSGAFYGASFSIENATMTSRDDYQLIITLLRKLADIIQHNLIKGVVFDKMIDIKNFDFQTFIPYQQIEYISKGIVDNPFTPHIQSDEIVALIKIVSDEEIAQAFEIFTNNKNDKSKIYIAKDEHTQQYVSQNKTMKIYNLQDLQSILTFREIKEVTPVKISEKSIPKETINSNKNAENIPATPKNGQIPHQFIHKKNILDKLSDFLDRHSKNIMLMVALFFIIGFIYITHSFGGFSFFATDDKKDSKDTPQELSREDIQGNNSIVKMFRLNVHESANGSIDDVARRIFFDYIKNHDNTNNFANTINQAKQDNRLTLDKFKKILIESNPEYTLNAEATEEVLNKLKINPDIFTVYVKKPNAPSNIAKNDNKEVRKEALVKPKDKKEEKEIKKEDVKEDKPKKKEDVKENENPNKEEENKKIEKIINTVIVLDGSVSAHALIAKHINSKFSDYEIIEFKSRKYSYNDGKLVNTSKGNNLPNDVEINVTATVVLRLKK